MRVGWRRWTVPTLVALVVVLVGADIVSESAREYWVGHAMAASIVSGLVVLAATVFVLEELLERRETRRYRVFAAQGVAAIRDRLDEIESAFEVVVNPTTGLELPAVRGRRDRIASPEEAAKLLVALPEHDRALWATALYAGLRRGEIMALCFEDVDLAAGRIRVERAWDPKAGLVEPKSRAGRRSVPILAVLRDYLIEAKLRSPWSEGFVFGQEPGEPFNYWTTVSRAQRAWKASKLAPIGLHEARHTFASLMIAAGVNAKALSTYLGHSSVTITYDRYGHLFPGNEGEAAHLLDTYLALARTTASKVNVPRSAG